ncbi:MAG TPA: RagB/SusD family nutrient uptake outer membrane protein [Prolixibacteraceae bacterium]|nr:RagB/SusD family nutrient uptake outer membrane protein [Prolixibacteraceae bacterium]
MKRISIIGFLFMLVLAGCDSFLDEKPQQSIDAEKALSTGENIRLVMNSAYVNTRNAFGQQLFHGAELLADNGEVYFQGTYLEPREYIGKYLVASSTWPQAAWQDLYKAIYISNQVLKHIEKVDETSRPQIEGEALFIRGLCYFELARFYAPAYDAGSQNTADAVPLVLETDEELYPARSTVAQVYSQARTDLETAASKLSEDENFFASRWAALGVLSRLYLVQELWAEAAQAASDVIGSGYFELSATPFEAFNHASNGPEDVFAFQQNNDENLGSENGTGNEGMSTFYASTNVTGRSDFAITETLFALYESDDLRAEIQVDLNEETSDEKDIKSLYYLGFGNSNDGGIFCAKWLNFANNMTFIRLAEMYLTRAEANFQNASTIGDTPLNDIKTIRERAGITTPESIDLDFIRKERIRELIFEGQRLHDYKRWEWPVGDLPPNSPRLVFPIPQRERDVNENLSQNEGY